MKFETALTIGLGIVILLVALLVATGIVTAEGHPSNPRIMSCKSPECACHRPPLSNAYQPAGMELVYLASPYSHKDPEVVLARYNHAVKATVWLINEYPNWNVFSPIVHSHILHTVGGLGGDWAFWKRVDTDYLERSNLVAILCLPGWDNSTGVTAETAIAKVLPNIGPMRIAYLIPFGPDNYQLSAHPPEHLIASYV